MSTASAVVPAGYKQTEIGVIPEDWSVKPAKELCRINQGLQIAIVNRLKIPSLNSKKYITIQYLNDGKIAEYIEDYSHSVTCNNDDILMTRTGNTGAVITNVEGVFHNNFFKIKYDKDKLTRDYLFNYLNLETLQKIILTKAGTSTIPDINHDDFYSIPIAFPCIDEQYAITNVINAVNVMIGSYQKIIAKKRDIKQGTMQALLTGRTRLPGFSGEWKNYNLIDVAKIIAGINKPASEMGQGVLYLTVKELYVGNYIDTKLLGRIRVSENEIDSKSLVLGDVIFGKSSVKREGIAYPNYFSGCSEPVIFSGFTFCARSNKSLIHARFLFYVLRFERTRNWVINNSQASALTNLNQSIAEQIPITMPVEKDEQEAIAEVLSDMDAEIAALEERLEKAKAIKQGMMQQLLTGKIRLVEPQTSQEVSA